MPDNNVDQWAKAGTQALQQTQAEQVRNNVQFAVGTNPDTEANYQHLARFVGVPVDAVRAAPADAQQQAALKNMDADKLVQQYPHTARFMGDSDQAKIMHDDVPGTANVEQAVKALPHYDTVVAYEPSMGQRVRAWINDAFGMSDRDNARAWIQYASRKEGITPDQARQAMGGASEIPLQAASKLVSTASFGLIPDLAGPANTGMGDVAGGLGSLAGFVLGGPIKATQYLGGKLGVSGLQHVAGESFAKALAKDVAVSGATLGTASALAEVGNAIDTPDLASFAKQEGKAAGSGAAMGAVFGAAGRMLPDSTLAQFAARALGVNATLDAMNGTNPLDDRPLEKKVFDYGLNTVFSMHGAGRAEGGWFHDAAKADLAVEDTAALHALGQISAASKLRERDPAAFKAFVDSVTDDGHLADVYIDVKQLTNALSQAGISDEALAAKLPEVAAQLHEARETSGDVRIAVSDYATHLAGGPVDEAILPHLKTDPEGSTYTEAQAFYQTQVESLKSSVDKIVAEHDQGEEIKASRDTLRDQILAQLTAANRFTAQVNQHYADMHADYYTVMASRAGMTPEQFADTYKLNVGAESLTGGHQFDQDGVRKIDTPEFKNWFGDSKVVDDDGKPLVVYHGTAGDFSTFGNKQDGELGEGHYFATSAESAAKWGMRKTPTDEGGYRRTGEDLNVMPTFLQLKNPATFADVEAAKKRLGKDWTADGLTADLEAAGFDGVWSPADDEIVAFHPEQIKSATGNNGEFNPNDPNILHQKARGQIAFGDDITRQASVMSLLKHADLSTFIHETGHFFLEVQADLAHKIEARIAAGEEVGQGERGILTDMTTVLDWLGVKGTAEVSATNEWGMMSLEEKRDKHETFARGFEAYAMEGKAPSVGLAKAYQAFRSWLLHVYKTMAALKVELTPEVRSVFDRMLATDDAIKTAEEVRGYRPLFESAVDAGMTPEEFASYQDLGKEATEAATTELDRRSLKDMQWMANAKNRAIKALQKEAAGKRRAVRDQVTAEVMAQPIYQAWQFLTIKGNKDTRAYPDLSDVIKSSPDYVDARVDSLFTAIAKNGGLNRAELKTKWGVTHKDMPDSGMFGKPILRKEGGLSIERMAEKLVEDHYLDAHDLTEFEEKFDAQRGGHEQYSWEYQHRGERPPVEGVDLAVSYHGKLDAVEVKRMFGEDSDVVRKLAERRMTSAKGGLDPDIVSETVGGFESGRELIEHLVDAETPHRVIEGMTDQRMLEQHGDLADARAIERAAEAAIHNEARGRFVASELRALASASDVRADNGTNRKGHRMTVSALARAAQEAADAGIAAKRVRDIRPAQYSAAEARAAKMAEKAMIGGDLKAAAVEKRAQLLNNKLVKAATDAVEEVRKGVQYLDKFDKPGVRKNIDLEYRDQIDALLDRYDLRKSTSGKALDKREALLAFVERMAAAGYEPQIPEKLLNEANRMHYKDMTVEEFRGLLDGVKSIEHLGRLKTRLLDLKETRELQELADEAVRTTGLLPQRAAESNRGLTRMEAKWLSVKSAGRSMQAGLLKMEQMFDWLDNRDTHGVFNRVVFRRIADAGTRENDLQAEIKGKIDALMHTHLVDVTREKGKIYTARGLVDGLTGKAQKFTKKEMLALAGNMGNESNTAKLLKGEKWDEAAVWDFLHQNMGKADWDFVAGLGKTLETLWPEKLAMSRRLGNTNPDKIAPRPFDTPHGQYEGWYWPMVYDPARAQDVAERGARSGDALFENIYAKANTDTGRMNTRSENYARPLLLSLDVIPRVIKDEIHDIAYREAIIDADKFLAHKDVREAITSALSPEHYDQLRPWLQSIASDRKVDMAALKWFDQLAHGARTRATIVGLGYRLSTMLVHGSSAAMESIAELGPKWMGKGLADFANPLQWSANKAFIFERSGEMRNRMNEVDRDVREHLREIEIRLMDTTTSVAARGADMMKAWAYQGIAMLDMASALPTWMGAYHRGMAAEADGGHGMGEADAVYFADKTVRNAHGGSGVKDMAAAQRGPEFFKLFTMFYTFWNHNVNRLMDTARLTKGMWGDFRAGDPIKTRDVGTVIMRTLIYTLGVQAMHGMLHPSEDDEGETNWLTWAAKEFGSAAFAGVPLLRDAAAYFIGGKDYSATPAAGIVDAIGRTGQDAMNAMVGAEANPKALKHTITTAGYVFGLPLGQPASAAQFLWDIEQGKQHPETAGDWLRGVMTGEIKKH